MKTALAIIALSAPLLCAAQINLQPAPVQAAAAAAGRASIDRQSIAKIELGLEDAIKALDQKDPFVLLGAVCGIRIEGYGVVLTAPMDLIATPRVTPFMQVVSKEQAERVRQIKLAHVPLLKEALRNAIAGVARSLVSLPPNEKIVVAARIFYLDWENRTGLPAQIVVSADRESALAGTVQTDVQ